MNPITIFTTHLNDTTTLFGKKGERKSFFNEKTADIQNEIFCLSKNKKVVWSCLNEKYQKEAIRAAKTPNDDINFWIKRINRKDESLEELWTTQQKYIIDHSEGYWTIYCAENHRNVYALDALPSPKKMVEWTTSLVHLAKAIYPESSVINLVLHDKDIEGKVVEHYVYREKEIEEAYGGHDNFSSFKKMEGIEKLNVILFNHTSSSRVSERLLNNESLKDVHKEVMAIIREENGNEPVDNKNVSERGNGIVNFDNKLKMTMSEIEKGIDPIGEVYK